jgi:hypothetical protein
VSCPQHCHCLHSQCRLWIRVCVPTRCTSTLPCFQALSESKNVFVPKLSLRNSNFTSSSQEPMSQQHGQSSMQQRYDTHLNYPANTGGVNTHQSGRMMKQLSDEHHTPFVCVNQVSDLVTDDTHPSIPQHRASCAVWTPPVTSSSGRHCLLLLPTLLLLFPSCFCSTFCSKLLPV